MPSFADARALAETMLAEHLPVHWRRVQSVAREALRISALPEVDRDVLIQAAVLHDIGRSPVVARAGFRPLDGARFLAARGYDDRVVALVAHRSGAATEAALRGIDGLERFPDEASPTRDALWYCDAVTGLQGLRVTPDERWAEPELRAAVDRTTARLDAAGLDRAVTES